MKIYQLVAKVDYPEIEDVVIGTFKNVDDCLNALADWSENNKALNEALENCLSEEDEELIMESVPKIYHCENPPQVKEYEILENYSPDLVKL
jgi:hypothetical protein